MSHSTYHTARMQELMDLVQQISGAGSHRETATVYSSSSARLDDGDGLCFDPSEITWLCRLAPVAVRCATAEEREEALERLRVVVDELPMALELRP